MNKILLLIVASMMLYFTGCTETPPSENPSRPECTEANEATTCGENKYCKDGFCKKMRCSERFQDDELCPEGKFCEEKSNGRWGCVLPDCSAANPNGKCPNGKFCDNGTCSIDDKCSSSHPNGKCEDGKTCIEGVCKALTCSAENPNGTCANGLLCKNGECVEDVCSETNKTGKCTNSEEYCLEGRCVAYECSADHPNGTCTNGKSCNNGVCEEVACDKDHPNGTCENGKLCVRVIEGGNYTYECQFPDECNYTDKPCDPGFICKEGFCKKDESCHPACGDRKLCRTGVCIDDPYYCNPESVNGWCPEGKVCSENGECVTPFVDPCATKDCTGKTCVVTSYENQEATCVENSDMCQESNPTGVCEEGKECIAGNCIKLVDPCENITCQAGEICNPATKECIDNACDPDPNCPEHMFCYNTFDNSKPYSCTCKPGYDFDSNQGKCVAHGALCDGQDCGLGECYEAQEIEGGWECRCNETTNVHAVASNPRSKCVDSSSYDFCLDMDCGTGTCRIIERDNERYATCDCQGNYYFDGATCVPGIECGNVFCENPLRQKCVNDQCIDQVCGAEYPEGDCNGGGETCVNGVCELTEECHGEIDGYCHGVGYECKDGICCKDGDCNNTNQNLKLIGELCDLESNNCENNAYCIPTPTGDGICMKSCDASNSTSCDTANGYHCLANGVFTGKNYEYIGVCVKDDNCNVTNNANCNDQQVCLTVRQTSATQCYSKDNSGYIGVSCNVSTSAMGFNIGCNDYSLCINHKCVPNCLKRDSENHLDITMCYDSYSSSFEIKGLKVKDFENLTFDAGAKKENTTLCTPGSSCGAGKNCVKFQEKDPTKATSKDLGICAASCNFDSTPYRTQCSNDQICYKNSYNVSLCLDGQECNTYTNEGCVNGVCYPITETINSCMSSLDTQAHIGDECNLTDMSCVEGLCVNGTCQLVCDTNNNDFTCFDNTKTCQSTTDTYLNSSSHFSSTHYGTCQ